MLTDNQIKAVFLECDNKDPDGMYANDVDIFEYGRAIERAVREDERQACVNMVKSLNHEVAKALLDYRRLSDKVE
jgi:hypothetical protein